MKFNLYYKKKKIDIEVIECKNLFSKARGLMFRKKSKPLLFIFKKDTNESIHSFFCQKFIGIWFKDDKILEIKLVSPWKINIKPKNKFNKLLEIPESDKNFKRFVDEKRKL